MWDGRRAEGLWSGDRRHLSQYADTCLRMWLAGWDVIQGTQKGLSQLGRGPS